MRVLSDVKPTAEQLTILSDYRPGCVLIRGAAGSGKTTTAVLRLKLVTGVWRRQFQRDGADRQVRVLVLTYNRTLKGYVEELVTQQVDTSSFDLTLDTFARWSYNHLGRPSLVDAERAASKVWSLGSSMGYDRDFLLNEVEYVLGRYLPENLPFYLDQSARERYERTGRGAAPRVDQTQRERLLAEVIGGYTEWKTGEGFADWSDIAVMMATTDRLDAYDIVVIDEAQDFSANQIRGVMRHVTEPYSVTFVLDAVQRIYPRGFYSWREVGVDIVQSYRLSVNHRNTRQIAAFARPLVADLPIEDDGTLPDFESSDSDGPVPVVVRGRFQSQMDWISERIGGLPRSESVALLHPKGGGWFDYVRRRLDEAGLDYVELTGRPEWPRGPAQVGLSTIHSAKGLEFDHVILLGLNAEVMPHGDDEEDSQLIVLRKLAAMGIGRARQSCAITFKPDDAAGVIRYLDAATYKAVDV